MTYLYVIFSHLYQKTWYSLMFHNSHINILVMTMFSNRTLNTSVKWELMFLPEKTSLNLNTFKRHFPAGVLCLISKKECNSQGISVISLHFQIGMCKGMIYFFLLKHNLLFVKCHNFLFQSMESYICFRQKTSFRINYLNMISSLQWTKWKALEEKIWIKPNTDTLDKKLLKLVNTPLKTI